MRAWRCAGLAVASALAIAWAAPAALATPPGMQARIGGPPEVQRVGNSYIVTVNVTRGPDWVPRLCLDFGDSNNSWKIVMPGLKSYNDDVFCFGTMKSKRKQFIARIVAAKAGQKTLEICLGRSKSIEGKWAILEDDQLCWHDDFVLV